MGRKVWLSPSKLVTVGRQYIHRDSLPPEPDTSLPHKLLSHSKLGYLLNVNYNPADTLESSYKTTYSFTGYATGQVYFTHENALNDKVDIGIVGAKVQLYWKRNAQSDVVIGHGTTSENGNFSIYYDFTSGNDNDKKLFVKIWAHDFNGNELIVMNGQTKFG